MSLLLTVTDKQSTLWGTCKRRLITYTTSSVLLCNIGMCGVMMSEEKDRKKDPCEITIHLYSFHPVSMDKAKKHHVLAEKQGDIYRVE